MTSDTYCKATNLDGTLCKSRHLKDSDFCFTHDPRLEVERAMARKLGGEHVKNLGGLPIIIQTTDDVMAIISKVVGNLMSMDVSVSQCKTLLLASQTALDAIQIKALEERITAMEDRMDNYVKKPIDTN